MATANQIARFHASMTTLIQNKRVQRKDKHMELLHQIFLNPIVTIASVQDTLKISRHAATRYIKRFINWGILVDKSGFRKERRYVCARYLRMLEENSPTTDRL